VAPRRIELRAGPGDASERERSKSLDFRELERAVFDTGRARKAA